jgi:hypothetical protein
MKRSYPETVELIFSLLALNSGPKAYAVLNRDHPDDHMLRAMYDLYKKDDDQKSKLMAEYRKIQAAEYKAQTETMTDDRCLQVCRTFIETMAQAEPKKRNAVVPGYERTGPKAGLKILADHPKRDPGERPVAGKDAEAGVPRQGNGASITVVRQQ